MQFIDAKLTNNHPNQLTFEENDTSAHGFSELYSLYFSSMALFHFPAFTQLKREKGFTIERGTGELKNHSLIYICDIMLGINLPF